MDQRKQAIEQVRRDLAGEQGKLDQFEATIAEWRGCLDVLTHLAGELPPAEVLQRGRAYADLVLGAGRFDQFLVSLMRGAETMNRMRTLRDMLAVLERDD